LQKAQNLKQSQAMHCQHSQCRDRQRQRPPEPAPSWISGALSSPAPGDFLSSQ
jgi:hypothetical protein